METQSKEETERIIRMLRTALRLLGFTNREIERRLSYTPSYLTRLFSGQIELRFEHVVDIASAMGLTAEEFFQFAYPARKRERSEPATKLDEVLEELRPAGRDPEGIRELQQLVSRLIEQNIDKFPKARVPEPPTEGVNFIQPRDEKSPSKRSGRPKSRKR